MSKTMEGKEVLKAMFECRVQSFFQEEVKELGILDIISINKSYEAAANFLDINYQGLLERVLGEKNFAEDLDNPGCDVCGIFDAVVDNDGVNMCEGCHDV